jgi:hypothetical protein
MTLAVDDLRSGPDPVFRSTFLCFQLAIAEDARVFGHWLADVMENAEMCGSGRTCLRGVALDLRHLERFVGAARLDVGEAKRHLRSFAGLIGEALKEVILGQRRTPAFRETFLALLPEEEQRAARSLGVYLQGALAEAQVDRQPGSARQGAIAELGFLAAHLRALTTEPEAFAHQPPAEQRLARFAGRMADRLETLARRVAEQQLAPQTTNTLRGETA